MHQFGIDGHMGYGGFHLTQFFRFGNKNAMKDAEKNFVDGSLEGWGKLFVYLLPTFFALLGWYLMGKKNRNVAIFFISDHPFDHPVHGVVHELLPTAPAATTGLNITAGRQSGEQGPMPTIYREVRVRDYFFSAGFMFFSMWMGLSAGLVLYRLFTDKNKTIGTLIAPLALVLFAVSPALPLSQNYKLRDRSKNFLPFEYAYNLLMSCAKNGILFTNGDNDTFPVWAVQEAYGIRPDVQAGEPEPREYRLVYQAAQERGAARADLLFRPGDRGDAAGIQPLRIPDPGEIAEFRASHNAAGRAEQQLLRVQDKMVLNIADATNFSKPVYFACSVSPDNFMGLGPYLQMQGMVYRLMPQKVPDKDQVDIDKMTYLLDGVYKLRPMPQQITERDEPYAGIANDCSICFLWLGYNLQERLGLLDTEIKSGASPDTAGIGGKKAAPRRDTTGLGEKQLTFKKEFDLAIRELDRCVSIMPWNMQPIMLRQQILMKFHQPKMAEDRLRPLLDVNPKEMQIRDYLGQALEAQGKRAEAESLFQGLIPTGG